MAIQQVNVYAFTLGLKSKQATGEHTGTQVYAIGATPDAAQTVVTTQFGSDISVMRGPVLVRTGAYTSLA